MQVNSIAEAVGHLWSVDPFWIGLVLAVLAGLVIMGGVKSIGNVAGVMVPIMAMLYVLGGLVIIFIHYEQIPAAFALIFKSAFEGQAAFGGFAGSSVMMALQHGVARSVFSNEAGLGISSMAAAAARTDSPGRQAMITMTGALLSTILVCTITGLVISVTQVMGTTGPSGKVLNGAALALTAFGTLPGGIYIVTIGLVLFAFSTVIAWAFYGERCCEYLFGAKSIIFYRLIYTLVIIPGAAVKIELAWSLADIMNGLMVFPNLIGLIGLSGVISSETNLFLAQLREERQSALQV